LGVVMDGWGAFRNKFPWITTMGCTCQEYKIGHASIKHTSFRHLGNIWTNLGRSNAVTHTHMHWVHLEWLGWTRSVDVVSFRCLRWIGHRDGIGYIYG
jgi:hypothetical protein